MAILPPLLQHARQAVRLARFHRLQRKYRAYTMIPPATYVANLRVATKCRDVAGCVVECGVWRGGMIAGIAEILGPDRHYHLFDSFAGLPPAQTIDGPAALAWQAATESEHYFDNCRAPAAAAEEAMRLATAPQFTLHAGWFEQTLPDFVPEQPIALLRLDADWYDATRLCLERLYPHMSPGGLILIDDYYTWDGCCRAVHDFLVAGQLPVQIGRAHV
jgi:O-methyltransferase